jgi:hypothetical protein
MHGATAMNANSAADNETVARCPGPLSTPSVKARIMGNAPKKRATFPVAREYANPIS